MRPPCIAAFGIAAVWLQRVWLYVSSWVDDKFERCYQVMEAHDRRLLDAWMANRSDLVDFEVHAVIASDGAARKIAPQLR
jgi:hypothetical protein